MSKPPGASGSGSQERKAPPAGASLAPEPVRKPPRPRGFETQEQDAPTLSATVDGTDRSELALSQLLVAAQRISSGVDDAIQARDVLYHELQSLSVPQAVQSSESLALEARVHELEDLLSRQVVEAERERSNMLEEQDTFLAGLIDEYEAAVLNAERERDEVLAQVRRQQKQPSPAPDLHELDTLQAELADSKRMVERLLADRDRMRDVLRRLQKQRDQAHRELASLKRQLDAVDEDHRPTTRPPPDPGPSLDESWDSLALPAPPPSMGSSFDARPPNLPSITTSSSGSHSLNAKLPVSPALRATPAPEELRSAILTPPPPPEPARPLRAQSSVAPATLKDKPPLSERPLIGYSVVSDPADSPRVERLPMRKPPKR